MRFLDWFWRETGSETKLNRKFNLSKQIFIKNLLKWK